MAVLVLAEGAKRDTVTCVICLQSVPLNQVTPGSQYANGHQAFACTVHLHDRPRWIIDWAVFSTNERQQKEILNLAEELG